MFPCAKVPLGAQVERALLAGGPPAILVPSGAAETQARSLRRGCARHRRRWGAEALRWLASVAAKSQRVAAVALIVVEARQPDSQIHPSSAPLPLSIGYMRARWLVRSFVRSLVR